MLKFDQLRANYRIGSNGRGIAPPGFKLDYAKNDKYAEGRPPSLDWHSVNTCATRLSDAITRVDPSFFRGVNAGPKWQEPISSHARKLPMNAGGLAGALRSKLGTPVRVHDRAALMSRRGIIFFDTIDIYPGVSGHISLWDNAHVVDGGEFFPSSPDGHSPLIYFWEIK